MVLSLFLVAVRYKIIIRAGIAPQFQRLQPLVIWLCGEKRTELIYAKAEYIGADIMGRPSVTGPWVIKPRHGAMISSVLRLMAWVWILLTRGGVVFHKPMR